MVLPDSVKDNDEEPEQKIVVTDASFVDIKLTQVSQQFRNLEAPHTALAHFFRSVTGSMLISGGRVGGRGIGRMPQAFRSVQRNTR